MASTGTTSFLPAARLFSYQKKSKSEGNLKVQAFHSLRIFPVKVYGPVDWMVVKKLLPTEHRAAILATLD